MTATLAALDALPVPGPASGTDLPVRSAATSPAGAVVDGGQPSPALKLGVE